MLPIGSMLTTILVGFVSFASFYILRQRLPKVYAYINQRITVFAVAGLLALAVAYFLGSPAWFTSALLGMTAALFIGVLLSRNIQAY